MHIYSFERLNVWQEAINLVEIVYKLVKMFPQDEKFGFVSQMKRASVSVASNLAEGTSRKTNKDQAHFSTMAFSSLMELLNQIIIANRLGFLSESDYHLLRDKISKVSNMINALRKAQLK